MCAEREACGHRASVADAAGGNDRNVDLRGNEGDQHHRADIARVLEAAAFAAFDNEAVDSRSHGLQRRCQCWNHVEHGEAGVFELCGVFGGVASRCGDELDALVHHELHDRGVTHKQLGNVHAEWLVGEFAHLDDFVAHRVELAR